MQKKRSLTMIYQEEATEGTESRLLHGLQGPPLPNCFIGHGHIWGDKGMRLPSLISFTKQERLLVSTWLL